MFSKSVAWRSIERRYSYLVWSHETFVYVYQRRAQLLLLGGRSCGRPAKTWLSLWGINLKKVSSTRSYSSFTVH